MKILITIIIILCGINLNAQMVVVTDDANYSPLSSNSLLDVSAQNNDKGVLIPRLSTSQRNSISINSNNDKGLLVYDTNTESFWYHDGEKWNEIGMETSSALIDNDGDTKIEVEKNTDENYIRFTTSGSERLFLKGIKAGIGNSDPISILHIGEEDSNRGILTIAGGNSGNNEGGELQIAIPPDYDSNEDFWRIDSYKDVFRIGKQGSTLLELLNNHGIKIGTSLTAPSYYECVLGHYNTDYTPNSSTSWNSSDRLFVLGNGTSSSNKSNAMVVLKNGNIGLGVSTPETSIDILGDGQANVRMDNSNGQNTYLNRWSDRFEILSSDEIKFATNEIGQTKMSLIPSGYLGIGTSAPGSLLDIAGKVSIGNIGNSVFIGDSAGMSDDLSNNRNVFIGNGAGQSNTTGEYNTVVGTYALKSNSIGNRNSAAGAYSLYNNNDDGNTAAGAFCLSTVNKDDNTACGAFALHNTVEDWLFAFGAYSLYNENTTSAQTSSFGAKSMYNTNKVYYSNSFGAYSLYSATGTDEISGTISFGSHALFTTTRSPNSCTVMGYKAAFNTTYSSSIIAIGAYCLSVSDYTAGHSAIGNDAFTIGGGYYHNSSAIGYDAEPNGSNQVRFGNSSVSWIGGNVGWSSSSDARFKTNISEDVKGLSFVLRLRPVTYFLDVDKMNQLVGTTDTVSFTEKYSIENIKQSGFIAQEVEQAAIEVKYGFSAVHKLGDNGDSYSLSYATFVVPLVKATQEQQAILDQQAIKLNNQKTSLVALNKKLSQLEKEIINSTKN